MYPRLPAILRLDAFRNLWLGQAISQLGDAFYYVAFMYMVQKVTGSGAWVGAVGALESLPFLIFGPYAGVVADRIDRRRIMLVSDLVSGATLLLFGLSILAFGKPMLWTLLAVPFILSTVRVFFMPAKSAAIPTVVPNEELTRANALSMTTQNLMPLMGLALSAGILGLLYKLSPTFFYISIAVVNSFSFLGSAVFIRRLPELLPARKGGEPTHAIADLKEGVAYLRQRHDLKVFTALLTVFRLFVAPFFVVYLAANDQWFGGKPETITWFEFSFFAGMVTGSAFAGRIPVLHPTRWFGACLAVVGLSVGAMAFSPSIGLFVLWNVIAGLVIPLGDIPMMTYMQRSVPDAFRGRVSAVRDMIATGIMPIGMSLAGVMVDKAGLVVSFLIMGGGMTLACLYGFLDSRYRNVTTPEEAVDKPAETSPEPSVAALG